MEKTRAYTIFLGLLIGAMVGAGVGAINGNAPHGLQLGAVAGLFVGWIMTDLVVQK